MNREMLRSVIRHSILTSMALDAVGYSFNQYSNEEKMEWHLGPRMNFPVRKGIDIHTGKGSYNSSMFLATIMSLAEIEPRYVDEIEDFLEDYEKVLSRMECEDLFKDYSDKYYYALKSNSMVSNGLLLPVAIAIGYYSALHFLPVKTFFSIVDGCFSLFPVDQDEYDAGLFLSFIIYRLCHTGYFGYETLMEARNYGVLSKLGNVTNYLLETHPTIERLIELDTHWLDGLSYSQRLLVYMVFYMLRVDTANPEGVIDVLPREQLIDVLSIKDIDEQDSGFVFGAICTASEHKHPLVPKPLRESVQYVELVNSALKYA